MRLNSDTSELDADSKQIKENRLNGLDTYNRSVRAILDYYYTLLEREKLMDFVSAQDRKQYNRDIRSFLKDNKTRKNPLDIEDTKRAILIAFNNQWYKKQDKLRLLLKLSNILRSQNYLSDAMNRKNETGLSTKKTKKYFIVDENSESLDKNDWGFFTTGVKGNLIHIEGVLTKKVKTEEHRRMRGDKSNTLKDEYFTKQGTIRGKYGWMVGLQGGNDKIFVGEEI